MKLYLLCLTELKDWFSLVLYSTIVDGYTSYIFMCFLLFYLAGVRDYLHITDLAKGHIAAMSKVKDSAGFKVNLVKSESESEFNTEIACIYLFLLYFKTVCGWLNLLLYDGRWYHQSLPCGYLSRTRGCGSKTPKERSERKNPWVVCFVGEIHEPASHLLASPAAARVSDI